MENYFLLIDMFSDKPLLFTKITEYNEVKNEAGIRCSTRLVDIIFDGFDYSNGKMMFKKEGEFTSWMFHFFNPDEEDTAWKDTIEFPKNEYGKILEFPDNKSALLWFKLEYGE